jgi:hypothetical protein
MDVCIRSRLTSGLAVLGVSALVLTPVASRDAPIGTEQAPVALAAQAQPFSAQATFGPQSAADRDW